MCWKYEDEYPSCFDWMYIVTDEYGVSEMTSQITFQQFLGNWDIKVDNIDELIKEFWELLSKWHEEGKIKPMSKDEQNNFERSNEIYIQDRTRYYEILNKGKKK